MVAENNELQRYRELSVLRPEEFINSGIYDIELDLAIVAEYSKSNHIRLGVLYESDYTYLVVDLVKDGDGGYFPYERILKKNTGSAVVIIPVWEDKVVLLHQYRHSMRGMQYAFPRGYAEEHLSVEDNAKKELNEEIGATALEVTCIGEVVADSGISGEKVSVCVAKIDGFKHPDGNEGITRILPVSMDRLNRMVDDRQIDDGFTLSALTLYGMQK